MPRHRLPQRTATFRACVLLALWLLQFLVGEVLDTAPRLDPSLSLSIGLLALVALVVNLWFGMSLILAARSWQRLVGWVVFLLTALSIGFQQLDNALPGF